MNPGDPDPRAMARLAWAWIEDSGGRTDRRLPSGFRDRFAVHPPGLRPDRGGAAFALTPVVEFRALSRGDRPAAYCPSCLEPVVLKLGRRNRAHYAHRPGAACAAAGGEGALHLDAKLHLAGELALIAGPLGFQRVCAGVMGERSGPCARSAIEVWPVQWDEVAVEREVAGGRPDVALLRSGRVVAALEVRSTNAVDAVRADRYGDAGLPWLEVPATSLVPVAAPPWQPASALDVVEDSARFPDAWRCPVCGPRHRARLALAENGVSPVAWRPAHLYLRDGGRSSGEVRVRELDLLLMERRERGTPVEYWLERSDTHSAISASIPSREDTTPLVQAHEALREWADGLRLSRGARVDSPASWSVNRERGAHPQRLRWESGRFRGAPNLPARAWPLKADAAAGWIRPHPVLGYARCGWAERHPRRGVVTHQIAGPWWLSLTVQAWQADDGLRTQATVAAARHDGRAWRGVASATLESGDVDWPMRLAEAAETVARDGAVTDASLAAALEPTERAEPLDGQSGA